MNHTLKQQQLSSVFNTTKHVPNGEDNSIYLNSALDTKKSKIEEIPTAQSTKKLNSKTRGASKRRRKEATSVAQETTATIGKRIHVVETSEPTQELVRIPRIDTVSQKTKSLIRGARKGSTSKSPLRGGELINISHLLVSNTPDFVKTPPESEIVEEDSPLQFVQPKKQLPSAQTMQLIAKLRKTGTATSTVSPTQHLVK